LGYVEHAPTTFSIKKFEQNTKMPPTSLVITQNTYIKI
jgi:hypothetical protein